MVWVRFQIVGVHFFLMVFFLLSSAPPLCASISQTKTMKMNELAPKAVVTLKNKAPVSLMDHTDNV